MKQKVFIVLSFIFALLLINSGLNKFFNYMPMPEDMSEAMVNDFKALMEIAWLMPLVAIAEIIAGMLIMFTKPRALGALVIFPIMVGILLTHIFVDTSTLIIAIVMSVILGWIMYENREKYLGLLK